VLSRVYVVKSSTVTYRAQGPASEKDEYCQTLGNDFTTSLQNIENQELAQRQIPAERILNDTAVKA
jgi:hypothetical protein